MPRPTTLTTLRLRHGSTLVLYRMGPTCHVGLLDSHQRPFPLPDSTYATYAAAHARLLTEAARRRRGPGPR